MNSISSLMPEKLGIWCGMLLAGGALVIGGAKALEHASFVPAEAQVMGTEIRCEMSNSGVRQARSTQVVMCRDVDLVKAQISDIDWRVSAQPFVTLAFTTANGGQVLTQVPLSTLDRQTTSVGDRVSILYRPERPTFVTAQATKTFFAVNGSALAGGLLLCAMAFGLRREPAAEEHRDIPATEASATLPHVKSPSLWAEHTQGVMTTHNV